LGKTKQNRTKTKTQNEKDEQHWRKQVKDLPMTKVNITLYKAKWLRLLKNWSHHVCTCF
jgi:hypothetical protein